MSKNVLIPKRDGENFQFFTPFGPTVGYMKLSDDLVDTLNNLVDGHDSGDNEMPDYSDQLVGKVGEELFLEKKILTDIIGEEIKDFVASWWLYSRSRQELKQVSFKDDTEYMIDIQSGWIVRQYQHEYNPIHIHTGCEFSCIGYLKMPDDIEDEFKADWEDHHPTHGMTQFVFGNQLGHISNNFFIRPQVGDFYFFPASLQHMVYPFYCEGERRAFSLNVNFNSREKEIGDEAST